MQRRSTQFYRISQAGTPKYNVEPISTPASLQIPIPKEQSRFSLFSVIPPCFQETFFQLLAGYDLQKINTSKNPEEEKLDPSGSLQLCNFFLLHNILKHKETNREWMHILILLMRYLPRPLGSIVLSYHDIAPETAYLPRFFIFSKESKQITKLSSNDASQIFRYINTASF